jgi:polynucleotide 5'-kinase involved in rRNA processing
VHRAIDVSKQDVNSFPPSRVAGAPGLLELQPAPMNAYDRSECLPETRVDILRFIEDWASDTSIEQSVLWLHGLAGAGKSALSTTLAERLRAAGRLGTFFF